MFTLTPPVTNLVYSTLGRARGDSDRFYGPLVDYEQAEFYILNYRILV